MICPRSGCGGLVLSEYEITRCVSCGWHLNIPEADPIVADDAKRWESVLCVSCHEHPVVPNYVQCATCRLRSSLRKVGNESRMKPLIERKG